MNLSRVTYTFLFLYPVFLLSCHEKGPLETGLDRAYLDYEKIKKTGEIDNGKFRILLQDNIHILSENSFTDESDIKNSKNITYRAALLLSAVMYHLEEGKEIRSTSRGLYINAYLIDQKNALNGIKKLLPPDADTEIYRNIQIPNYTAENKFTENESDGMKPESHLVSVIRIKEELPYYLLQTIGGDILYKTRNKKENLSSVHLDFFLENGAKIATASWDKISDEMTVDLIQK